MCLCSRTKSGKALVILYHSALAEMDRNGLFLEAAAAALSPGHPSDPAVIQHLIHKENQRSVGSCHCFIF